MTSSWENQHDNKKRTAIAIAVIIGIVILAVVLNNNSDLFGGREGSKRGTTTPAKATVSAPSKEKEAKKETKKAEKNDKKNVAAKKTKSETKSDLAVRAKKPENEKNIQAENRKTEAIASDDEDVIVEKQKKQVDDRGSVAQAQTTGSIQDTGNDRLIRSLHESMLSLPLEGIHCNLSGADQFFVNVSLKLFFKGVKTQKELLLKREELKVMVKKVMRGKDLSNVFVETLRDELRGEMNKIVENGSIEDIEFIDFKPVAY